MSTSPSDQATKVPVTATISATFSEAMSTASVVEGAFQITPVVDGALSYAGTTVTLTPRAPLAYATTYTVTIGTAAKDAAGNPLAASHAWSFTTAEAPPVVTSTSPAADATGVAVDATITATFSKSMAPDTINAATFTLSPAIQGAVTYAGTTASFKSAAPLAWATKYTATITAAAKDLAGNALAADYVWNFTTAPLPSAPVAVAGPAQDVNRGTTVTLDGSASHADSGLGLTYTWTQVLGADVTGGAGKLTGVRPTFTAPSAVTTLQFDLVVNDTLADSLADRLQINVMKDATKAIFVAKTGADSAAGTRSAPMLTIQAAIAKAAGPRADLYVGGGQYTESIALANGVSIFGGFDDVHGWVRTDASSTTLAAATPVAVFGDSLAGGLEIDRLAISAGPATLPATSSIGVRISNSTGPVVLRGCSISASNGAPGGTGPSGFPGTTGGNAGSGGAGTRGGGAGAAGSSICGARGGAGGPGVTGFSDGNPGAPGTGIPGGGPGGPGGIAATGAGKCGDPTTHGNPAPDTAIAGFPGANGANGGAAASLGTFSGTSYVPPLGRNGSAGKAGGGGGGGGSGSGDTTFNFPNCNPDTSGGGGGGGGGGCPGTAGTGGQGGGGSFAVVSLSSVVAVDTCSLTTGNGGAGGRGGNGGQNASGGLGASGGGAGAGTAGAGAPGKDGGSAGWSGSGSGGPGGPSICVAFTGTHPSIASIACTRGTGGPPGAGGANAGLGTAPNGATGLSVDVGAF